MGPQFPDAFRRRVDRATDARTGGSRRGPQRGEQVVQEQHGLARRGADDIAAMIDSPTFTKTDKDNVSLFGIDEYIANVLQAGQKDNFFRKRLAGLQRLFDGFFHSAERDLTEGSGRIEVGRGLLDQPGPLGPEPAKRIDAGILDQPIGLDRDAANCLLVAEEKPVPGGVVGDWCYWSY